MHEIELITRSGPIILMAKTRKQLYAAFRRFVNPNKEEKMGNYNDKHYDDDPFFDCDFPDLDISEQRHCERCQNLTECELIPLHGYSESGSKTFTRNWLCRKCAAATYRVADAI